MADRYHHGNLREALVDAGLSILARDGAAAVTLRAVARKVGVSHAAPYSHFRDRDDLLAAVAVPGMRELARRLATAAEAETGAEERIRAIGRAYVSRAIERPDEYRLIFGPRVAAFDTHEDLAAASRDAFDVLREAIEAGQAGGRVTRGPSAGLATFAWAALHGVASLFVDGRLDVGEGQVRDRLVSTMTSRILDGIGSREA